MFNFKIPANLVVLLLISVILSSCALSPQTVSIVPVIDIKEAGTGQDTRLAIEVRDTRQGNIIGYRGGIYDTAAISTRGDITGPIHKELVHAFSAIGFTVVNKGDSSDSSLVAELQELNYKIQQKNLIRTVEIFAVMKAQAVKGTKTVTQNIEDRFTKNYPKSPSTGENEKLINDIISRLLQRIVQDDEFISSLRN